MKLFVLTFLFPLFSWAIDIPSNLSQSDRKDVMEILGVASSSKILSNPFPLGGYPGFELGLSYEIINTKNLHNLGNGGTQQNQLKLPQLTISKGLYENIDLQFHFTPETQTEKTRAYGGIVKWGVAQGTFIPINFSMILHGSHISVGDSFSNQTLGLEAMTGVSVNNFSIYFGGGILRAKGRFMSGTGSGSVVSTTDPDLKTSTNTLAETLNSTHTFAGISLNLDSLFVAGQIDRYQSPAYSAKLGLRF